MWWYFVKKSEDENKYVYLFAFETKKTTGELEYNKADGKIEIAKYAENTSDDKKSDIVYAMLHVVNSGFPDTRVVAYG
jgi:hypothetical protein